MCYELLSGVALTGELSQRYQKIEDQSWDAKVKTRERYEDCGVLSQCSRAARSLL